MGIRKVKKEELNRLAWKTVETEFANRVREGMECSPFEAEGILGIAKEVYYPFLDKSRPISRPGLMTLIAVSADEPAGKPIANCEKQTVCLAVHRGEEDDRLLVKKGPQAFRQARIAELCQEAMSQGALLTREDLAYRIFFVSPRTISRDLAALRKKDPHMVIPLRSTVHDIGPTLTHRVEIIRLALEGKTTSQICQQMRHSPQSISNYLQTFIRCAQLNLRGMTRKQIAYVLHRGEGLVQQYIDLLEQCKGDPTLSYHLDEMLRLGQVGEKKGNGRRKSHGS